MEQERLAAQYQDHQLENELHDENKKRFALEMEIEKFSRKGKQPVGKQAQRQQPNILLRDEFDDDRKNKLNPMATDQ